MSAQHFRDAAFRRTLGALQPATVKDIDFPLRISAP